MDEKYRAIVSSMRTGGRRMPLSKDGTLKLSDLKKDKGVRQNRVYYSHSPSPCVVEPLNKMTSFKQLGGKLPGYKAGKLKMDPSEKALKKIMIAGSNTKKFPKDFF